MSKVDQWKGFGSAVIVLKQLPSPSVQEVDTHTELRFHAERGAGWQIHEGECICVTYCFSENLNHCMCYEGSKPL